MFKRGFLASILIVASLIASHHQVFADECGDISIASMNWASAEVIAEIDRLILSAGYGCNVEFTSGDALPLLASMRKTGKPDLVSELWESSVSSQLQSAVARGDVLILVDVLSDGGEEGFWIPRYIADENPQIKTMEDALARPDLFVANSEDSTGLIYNCPADWECHVATGNLFRAFGAEEKGFSLVNTGSAAALDASIARAYESKAGWLGYYWAPTAFLGRYEMVKLEMGDHDEVQWNNCIAVPDCTDPVINAWPTRRVLSVVSDDFSNRANDAITYVAARQWGNHTVNGLLAWMAENQATGEEAALHFLANYEDVWTAWVSTDVYARIKAVL